MKRFISILLSLAMVMTVVAAGAETAAVTETPPPCTEENVTVSTEAPITFSIFVDHTWYWMDNFNDQVAQEVTKRTGVYLDVTRATDSNQLAVLLASGDLPDLVYTSNASIINELSNSDVCWSYNELVDKTGVDLNTDPSEILLNTAPDGNYYALLNTYASQEMYDSGKVLLSGGAMTLSYRKDIYEALGSPAINSLEDLENLCILVKEKYPDMIPLLPVYEYNALSYFKQTLHVFDQDIGYNADGKVVYKLDADGAKDYYKLLNRYAREGIFSSEAMTYTYAQAQEVAYGGKVFGIIRATGEAGEANNNAKKTGTGYQWDLLEQDLSDNTLRTSIAAGWSGLFISKNCKDPERAIRFMAFCRSDEGRRLMSWGIQGVHWDYDENGNTKRTQYYWDMINAGKKHQADLGCGGWIFGDKGDENSFVDFSTNDELNIKGTNRRKNGASTMKVWSELSLCLPKDGDELLIYNKLTDMIKTEEIKVIFADGDEAFEAAYKNMMDRANSIGMQELETYLNQRLAEVKGTN